MQHISTVSNMIGEITSTEHTFQVPLDWSYPSGDTITLFVREISKTNQISATTPAVMFLQGGPGFPSPRPTGPPGGWIKVLLDKGNRVLLLDQRGTGRSTAMTPQRLSRLADSKDGVLTQVMYLKNMRSDAIAADIEHVRVSLCGQGKLSLLGQSFGGFCMLSYMSRYADHLDKCLFTCGLAPITRDIRDVYIATYRRVLTRNKRFYARYPQDKAKVKEIVAFLHLHSSAPLSSPIQLPGGGHLTVRRFLQLGIMLGMTSGMDSLHFLLEDAFLVTPACAGSLQAAVLNENFLYAVEHEQSVFESSPIYWLMHESIYMNGGGSVSGWAAEEVMHYPEFNDAFDYIKVIEETEAKVAGGEDSFPWINFTGEMVYSWMGEDYVRLRPLQEAASALAQLPWEKELYDLNAFANYSKSKIGSVKCAALVSYDDMYVERTFSEETAALLGGEDYCKMWITNEFQHSGIRDEPDRVIKMLWSMAKNEVNIPS